MFSESSTRIQLLPDEPVENTCQPLLAAALRESLELIGFLSPERLVASNLGICATVNGKTIVKAPDWLYVPRVLLIDPPRTRRSYTPSLEGDILAVVIEFLSLLLWGTERLELERQRVEKLESYLRDQGIDPDEIP